jgi:hypothetical protein
MLIGSLVDYNSSINRPSTPYWEIRTIIFKDGIHPTGYPYYNPDPCGVRKMINDRNKEGINVFFYNSECGMTDWP